MKGKYGYVVFCFILGLSIGILVPKKPSVKVETRYVEREDTWENVTSTTTVEEKPDGSKVTKTETRSDKQTARQSAETKKVAPVKPDWGVSLSRALTRGQDYSLSIQRRVLGDIYVGAYGSTQGDLGLTISVLF